MMPACRVGALILVVCLACMHGCREERVDSQAGGTDRSSAAATELPGDAIARIGQGAPEGAGPATEEQAASAVEGPATGPSPSQPHASPVPHPPPSGPSTAVAAARPPTSAAPGHAPLADATVGEWCRYRFLDDQEQVLQVERVDDAVVTIRVEMYLHGRMIGLPARRIERRGIDPVLEHARRRAAEVRREPAKIRAGLSPWDCELITETWTDEGVRCLQRTWRSAQVPVYGVVRMEKVEDGRQAAMMELIAWGVSPAGQ